MNNIINIGYTVSNKYANCLAVSMASILKNSGDEEFNFYILNADMTDENRRKIEVLKKIKPFNIEYVQMNNDDFKNMSEGISVVSNYRLKISSLFPNLDKILFLDSDIIALTSLKELYETPLDDYYIASVVDPGVKLQYEYTINDKEKFPDRRFNTGVMLANLKKWSEDNMEEKLFEGMLWYSSVYQTWPDQNVLNMVFKDYIYELPYTYNFCPILYQEGLYQELKFDKINVEELKIVHWAGGPKPWETNDVLKSLLEVGVPIFVEYPKLDKAKVFMNDIFWEYARLTPYYEDFMYTYIQGQNEKFRKEIASCIKISKILKNEYLKVRFLTNITLGKKKKHYQEKKAKIKQYLEILSEY